MSTQPYTPPLVGEMIRRINDSVSAQVGDLQMEFEQYKKESKKLRQEVLAIGDELKNLKIVMNLHGGVRSDNPALVAPLPSPESVSLGKIHDAVVSVLNFKGDLRFKSNRPAVCRARFLFAYVARKHGYSFPAIGRAVNYHHSSMMHGVRQVEQWITEQPDWAELVRKVEEQL